MDLEFMWQRRLAKTMTTAGRTCRRVVGSLVAILLLLSESLDQISAAPLGVLAILAAAAGLLGVVSGYLSQLGLSALLTGLAGGAGSLSLVIGVLALLGSYRIIGCGPLASMIPTLFLILGVGYLIGAIRIGSFSLGPVAGVLFAGLFLGHFDFQMSAGAQSVGFALFIFSVGYQAGPRFFDVLRTDGLKYFLLALVITASPARSNRPRYCGSRSRTARQKSRVSTKLRRPEWPK